LLFLISALAIGSWGWLLGMPFVLLVRNIRGWRFWFYLALGSCIAPGLFSLSLLHSHLTRSSSGSSPTTESPDYTAVPISAAISILTTLIYLLLLRRNQTEALPAVATGGQNPATGRSSQVQNTSTRR
jgi:hypothetical protein